MRSGIGPPQLSLLEAATKDVMFMTPGRPITARLVLRSSRRSASCGDDFQHVMWCSTSRLRGPVGKMEPYDQEILAMERILMPFWPLPIMVAAFPIVQQGDCLAWFLSSMLWKFYSRSPKRRFIRQNTCPEGTEAGPSRNLHIRYEGQLKEAPPCSSSHTYRSKMTPSGRIGMECDSGHPSDS